MRILLGNNHLQKVGGTENYTYALAEELLRRGHTVEYFTLSKGEISDRLENLGVKFMSHKSYDLILANHTRVVKRLCFRGFTIQTCHGVYPPLEQPVRTADAWVSVTEEVADHLRRKGFRSRVILNGIDCRRFSPQTELSSELRTVLSLCQSDKANAVLESCCRKMNLELIKCNKHVENLWDIEDTINMADIVVGIGRSLYDAMACGRCVISYDYRPYMQLGFGDGYLTASNIEPSIWYNCSGRGSGRHLGEKELVAEMLKYDSADGERNRKYALENLNIEKAVDSYLEYAEQCKASGLGVKKSLLRRFYAFKYGTEK